MAVNPSSSLAGLTQAVAEFNAEAVQKVKRNSICSV